MNLDQLLKFYMEFPSFSGVVLGDVNQIGNFGDRPLHLAASRGELQELEILIRHGADPNLPGEHDFTALHLAILMGRLEAVRFLIGAGADLTLCNDDGFTPLAYAKACMDIDPPEGRLEILKLLEEFPV